MSRGRPSGYATGRGRGRDGVRSSTITPLKGLFVDGIWHCNCTPRLPADRFQTKKEGVNHGRWFYTCQKSQTERCNFFLWDDDAKIRETAAVLSNSRSEPLPDSGAPSNRTSIPLSPPPPYSAFEIQSYSGGAPLLNSDSGSGWMAGSELSFDRPLNNEEGRLPLQVTDKLSGSTAASNKRTIQPPETPRKVPKADALDSPSKQWPSQHISGLPTPSTEGRSHDAFTTPSARASTASLSAQRNASQFPTPSVTPTPNRFRDVGAGLGEDSSLSDEILQVLDQTYELRSDTKEKIKSICNKHSLRTQGIAKGRDISRLAIKTKDAKIAELQGRIASLEAGKESDMATIRDLRRQLAGTEKS